MKRAERPPDARFPFGYGKEVYFWSFVVALLVFATGAGVSLYEGVRHLQHPATLESPVINYLVLAVAMVLEGAPWLLAYRRFERVNEVLTMHVGPEYILANISVDISAQVPRSRAHAIIDELDEHIRKADPRVKRVFIESQNAVA